MEPLAGSKQIRQVGCVGTDRPALTTTTMESDE